MRRLAVILALTIAALFIPVAAASASTAQPSASTAQPTRCTATTVTSHGRSVITDITSDSCHWWFQAWGKWTVYRYGLFVEGAGASSIASNGGTSLPSQGGYRQKSCNTCTITTHRTFGTAAPAAPTPRIWTRAVTARSCAPAIAWQWGTKFTHPWFKSEFTYNPCGGAMRAVIRCHYDNTRTGASHNQSFGGRTVTGLRYWTTAGCASEAQYNQRYAIWGGEQRASKAGEPWGAVVILHSF